mmetsp:Transcript_14199/g.24135  ORF Transcript_14199/g.24135 Transcript_14199/m.24135 type:complete len:177 (+) Transcript_14199:258-788(+)
MEKKVKIQQKVKREEEANKSASLLVKASNSRKGGIDKYSEVMNSHNFLLSEENSNRNPSKVVETSFLGASKDYSQLHKQLFKISSTTAADNQLKVGTFDLKNQKFGGLESQVYGTRGSNFKTVARDTAKAHAKSIITNHNPLNSYSNSLVANHEQSEVVYPNQSGRTTFQKENLTD